MADRPLLDRFFDEVARRRIFHAAGIYAVAGWFFVQAVATIAPYMGLPDWTLRLSLALVLLGLPVVLGLVWIFGDGSAEPSGPAGVGTGAGGGGGGTEAVRGSDAASRQDVGSRTGTGAGAGSGPVAGERPSRRSRWGDYALIVVLFLVGAGLWAYRNFVREPGVLGAGPAATGVRGVDASAEDIRSVAVLPFENVGGDPDNEYFSRGVSEEIRSVLAQVPGLRVPSRISSFRYAEGSMSLAEIADALDVEAVLDGSVRRAGDRVRVTVQLVDVRTDEHLFAETYDRALTVDGVFAVEDEVARAVAEALELELLGGATGAGRVRPVSLETHDLYLLGLYHWNRRTGPELQKAVELFRQAADREPDYALAHAGLANTYVLLPLYAGVSSSEAMPRAREAAQRALALDNGLAAAHAALGFVRTTHDWDWVGAEAAFQRAITLDPSYATAHEWYGLLLDALSRHDEAYRRHQRALELDPLSPIINQVLADHFIWIGDNRRAIDQLRHTLELHPGFPLALQFLAQCYIEAERFDEARATLHRWAELTGQDPSAWDPVVAGFDGTGSRDAATAAVRAMHETGVLGPFRAAEYHAMLGAAGPALDALETAHRERDFLMFLVATDPKFGELHDRDRFQAILRDMGLAGATGLGEGGGEGGGA